ITYPSGQIQQQLLSEFYKEVDISPNTVNYIEAHSTGTIAGDPEECDAIEKIFCKNRVEPMLIGSVKSNIGHTEASAGVCSIIKCIIASENYTIPPNIHFVSNRTDVPALINNKLKVVSESTPLEGSLLAINSFGFGGANAHALLHANSKNDNASDQPANDLPRLVIWSGRTPEAVDCLLDYLTQQELDEEFLGLLNNIQKQVIPKFNFRGFRVFTLADRVFYESPIVKVSKATGPLVVLLGDVDHLWAIKLEAFSKFPVFKHHLNRCLAILESMDISLPNLTDPTIGSVILQLGLLELLKATDIQIDHYTANSIGQYVCAHMDGLITVEQTLKLAIYHDQSPMYQISKSKEKLRAELNKVIPQKLNGSSKWLYSQNLDLFRSYQQQDLAHISSAKTNFSRIPSEAVIVDLKQLQKYDINANKIRQTDEEVSYHFLHILGEIFLSGRQLNLTNLYEPVEFPVSRGTASISSLIRWDHSASWFVMKFHAQRKTDSGVQEYSISLTDQDNSYLAGHCIDGRILFPATGYLQLVWEYVAMRKGVISQEMPIQFHDVQFHRATTLSANETVEFTLVMQEGSGQFEILEGTTTIVTGRASALVDPKFLSMDPPSSENTVLEKEDFYKELRLRGYHYGGIFKSVSKARSDGSFAKITWANNWVGFLDSMLQVQIISNDSRLLMIPTGIESLQIDPITHLRVKLSDNDGKDFYNLTHCPHLNVLQSGGIQISGLQASTISRRAPLGHPVLESYAFVPYNCKSLLPVPEIIRYSVQIMLENTPTTILNVCEYQPFFSPPIVQLFEQAISELPLVQGNLVLLSSDKHVLPASVRIAQETLSSQENAFCIIYYEDAYNDSFYCEAADALADEGYLIVRKSSDLQLDSFVVPKAYIIISIFRSTVESFILLKKFYPKDTSQMRIVEIASSDQEHTWLNKLKQTSSNESVIVYSQNEPHTGILGLVNCLRKEPATQNVKCFIIDDPKGPIFSQKTPFYQRQIQQDMAVNIYRNGQWGSYRHRLLTQDRTPLPISNHCFANCTKQGDLSSFTWFEGPLSVEQRCEGLVDVVFSSLNFKDVMLATGKLSIDSLSLNRLELECVLGFEFSGISAVDGRRVMGLLPSGTLASQVVSEPYMTFDVPPSWSLAEAASVPCVYGTVYTAFFVSCSIQAGKSILIHAGSGGVGIAAIETCLAYNLEVFTTVSSKEKRNFLLKRFPQLKRENIGKSRDTSFERMIKIRTEGQGVDYVLNSLAEEKLQASVRCLANGGHFFEIGKYDISKNSKLAMELFQKGITFTAIFLDLLFKGTINQKRRLHRMLTNDIQRGVIKPLPVTIFPAPEIEKAFRYLAGGKHMGKVLLRLRERDDSRCTLPLTVTARLYCSSDCTYIVLGGLGGFGLELTDWLVLRGCRNVILCSRRGISEPYQEYRIRTWQDYGVKVVVSTENISTESGCRSLITEATKLGPVAGIFNLAVQLRDASFENQTPETFAQCLAPKATATVLLDRLSREMCPELQHFVVFSSVSCGRGNAGQSNYGMANSVMERVVERRRADGLPAKAIQWGAVGDVGLIAAMTGERADFSIGGTLQQRIACCLHKLDQLLTCEEPIVSSMVVAEKSSGADKARNIVEAVMNIMNIRDLKSISLDSTFADIGMDSLMAVEIKQVMERDFNMILSPQELRTLTFLKLQKIMQEKCEMEGEVNETQSEGFIIMIKNLGCEATSEHTVLRLPSLSSDLLYDQAVLIVPGIESVAGNVWYSIASKINAPVFVLQTLKYYQSLNLEIIVNSVIDELLDKVFKKLEQFCIIGYSFGALIAIEIVKRLEKAGFKGKLILLDGSPKYLTQIAKPAISSSQTDEEIQISLIQTVLSTIGQKTNAIGKGTNFKQMIEDLMKFHRSDYGYSKKYLELMLVSLFNRIKIALSLNCQNYKNVLHCPIVLMKPSIASVSNTDHDYGLSEVTNAMVVVKTLQGTHATMLEDPTLVEGINQDFL
ncbi:fatty acid synthase-like, partial [Uranotaenia lowii]|uniref:fatty acid synthase-like n=1 Tax=Uranotaenia lowii TaxID=190385 RepID=UPI002478840A